MFFKKFTGKRDKNGKKIYDGDVIEGRTEWNLGTAEYEGKVHYSKQYAAYKVNGHVMVDEKIARDFMLKDIWEIKKI